MDSPLFSISDVAEEAKKHREKVNRSRRHNYKYNVQLSKNIDPFKKRSIKKIKSTTKKFFKSDTSSKMKHYSSIKLSISNEEIPLQSNSQQEIDESELCNLNFELSQEDLVVETTNKFNSDEDTPYSPNDTNESGRKFSIAVVLHSSSNSINREIEIENFGTFQQQNFKMNKA
jgi:hypothetical protein